MSATVGRVLAAIGAVVIVSAAFRVATIPELPLVLRCGVVGLLAVGLFSCVRAWISVPLRERQLASIYLGGLLGSVALMVVGYISR
jgi:hypothetical protein